MLASRLMALVQLGAHRANTPADARWSITINIVAMASMVLSTTFAVFYGVLDFDSLWPVVVTNVIWVGGYAAGMRLNWLGRRRRASWLMLATGWGNTLIPAAFLGATTGVFLFLILVPMLGVLMSGPDDRVYPVVVIGFGAVAFALMPTWFDQPPEVLRGSTVETVLFASSAIGVSVFGSLVALYFRRLVDMAETALAEANERSERLLLNILPEPIAGRLKAEESPIADRIDNVTVLFADLVDSTQLSERLSADELVALLDRIFSHFDDLVDKHGLEKIATIGDCYLAVAGMPVPRSDHAVAAAETALAMRDSLGQLQRPGDPPLGMRFGLSSGPVVAGVIGKRKFRYDLWGDTVNVASRMQTHGQPGLIHVTSGVCHALSDRYELQPRGNIDVKGKGMMETFFLIGPRNSIQTGTTGEPEEVSAHR